MRKAAAVSLVLLLLLGGAMFWLGDEEPNPSLLTRQAQVSAAPPARVVAWSPPVAGSSLKLRVSVTEGGKPVAGATVTASDKTGISDGAGQAVLEVVPGAVSLSARWEGRVVHRGLVISSLLGDQHVTLAFEDGEVSELKVLDSKTGQPIASARVELQMRSELEQRPAAVVFTSDGAGHVTLSGFKLDEFELTASHPGYVTAFAYLNERGLEALLQPHRPFTGRVLLPDGKPAAGASVTTSAAGAETATTSRDGTFSLLHAGDDLCVRLGELEASGSVDAAEEEGLVLAKVPAFAGQVFSSVGDQPLEGVRVRTSFGSFEAVTVTDREGNFLIPGLCLDDSHWATFELVGYLTESAPLERGEKNVIRLSGHGALRGIVIDEQGAGVEGAVVTARDTIVVASEEVTKTDADGRFSFERVKRELEVSAVLGTRSISQDVIVAAGQLVEMTLPISGERMSNRGCNSSTMRASPCATS